MKKFLSIYKNPLLLALLFLVAGPGFSQGISLTTNTTPSICYNDGTIAAKATGGTSPYSYSIIAGPVHPNLNYPIVLPLSSDTFIDLPSGTFSIVVVDAANRTDTFSATVGGTYQFPSLTYNLNYTPSIVVSVSGGLAPYQYAISSTGSNTGFGAYQSSDTFASQCPGQYWVRVIDSCSNIYTVPASFGYTPNITSICVNFSHGLLTASANNGHPPYTYTVLGETNTTGIFTNLPPYFTYGLCVTDSCGSRECSGYNNQDINISLFPNCSTDSNFAYVESALVPITLTCTNCNPPQTYVTPNNSTSGSAFSHLSFDTTYNIVATFANCAGLDTAIIIYPSRNPQIDFNQINCHTFDTRVWEFGGGLSPTIDSFVLSDSYGIRIEANSTGTFGYYPNGAPLSPDSIYYVTAYIDSSCGGGIILSDAFQLQSNIPFCYELMKDSTCQTSWAVYVLTNSNTYFLISSLGDTINQSLVSYFSPHPAFFEIPPGSSYNIIDNTGCSNGFITPLIPTTFGNITSSVTCAGVSEITYNLTFYIDNCAGPYHSLELFYNDSLVSFNRFQYSISTIQVSDSGWYKYFVYIPDYLFDVNPALRYNNICPLDSGWIYVSNSTIPYPNPNFSYVCNLSSHGDSVPFAIYGGSIPYTVEVLGYDTLSLSTNNGVFRAPHQGNYTMLVYDNCGISRSYTFSVIDTCSGCPIAAIGADTIHCSGDTVNLTSTSINASRYEWLVNGQLYSRSDDTILITDIGGDRVLLRAFSNTGCKDSVSVHIVDTCHPCFGLTSTINHYDTLIAGDTLHMSTNSYYQTGIYHDTLNNVHGCDSIINVYLYIDTPSSFATLYDTICRGSSYGIGTNRYTQSGTHIDTLVNHWSGDSIVTLHLYVAGSVTTVYDTICQGASVIIGANSYSQAGSYIDTLTGAHGCDSIINLNLIVFPAPIIYIYDTICQGTSVTFGLNTYSQSGVFSDTFMTLHGCDSIRSLDLIVLAFTFPSVTISVSQGPVIAGMQIDTFTAIDTDCVRPYYSWYDNKTPLGIHSPIAIVPYPQGANENIQCNINCHTECEVAQSVYSNSIHTGIANIISFIQSVKIYPNPTQGSFTMDINASNISNIDAQIQITDLLGQSILNMPIILHSGYNKETVSLEDATSGIYIAQLNVDGQALYYRIMLDKQ